MSRPCDFAECDNKHYCKGYCKGHYHQFKRGKPLQQLQDRHITTTRDEAGRKRCRTCKQWLPEAEFYRQSKSADGLNAQCISCTKSKQKPDPRARFKRHNVSKQWFDLQASRGCAICRSMYRLVIDHDHSCCPGPLSCGLCVRGVLCDKCNRALGYLDEDRERIVRAAQYLEGCLTTI